MAMVMETESKEDTVVQYLELVLKRDLASGWRHTVEKVRVLFDKTSEAGPKEKTEEIDWKDRAGKNWYY
jgi:hypothetical protein